CYYARLYSSFSFFFKSPATTEIYTLSLHDALPIYAHWVEIIGSDAQVITSSKIEGLSLWNKDRQRVQHIPGSFSKIDYRIINNQDRKSTRLNSSHVKISYAVFCLKKKKKNK